MKRKLILTSALLVLCFIGKAQLSYTKITSGLNTITFEGGEARFALGDVDGDGDLDIVSIGDHGNPFINSTESGIMVWKNNGNGTNWSHSQSGNFGYGGCALGDLNNDGKTDIAFGMHHTTTGSGFGSKFLEAALGDGTGNSWTAYDAGLPGVSTGMQWGMFGTALGDMNNDGWLDIASNSFGCCDGIWIYKNNGNGTWSVTDGAYGGNSRKDCALGDFNNDGNLDMATSNDLGQIWKGDGTGKLFSMQTGIPDYASIQSQIYLDVADVNNDGAKDIAIVAPADSTFSAFTVQVYTYNKSGNSWQNISTGLPASGVMGAGLADMDMDGNCDLVLWSSNAITIYKGDGTGNWTANGTITTPNNPYFGRSKALGDFDHDGYTDIVYLGDNGSGTNILNVYLHTVSAPALSILPVTPKGAECFAPGSVQFINWQSSVPVSTTATVKIEFSSTGNGGPWTTVVSSAPNSGIYQWTVPNVSSTNCFLRFTITNGSSTQVVTSANAFGVGSCVTPPPPTFVTNMEEESGISIFPNPSSGEFMIQSSGSNVQRVEVYDEIGEKVFSTTPNTKASTVNLDGPCGMYFLQIESGGKAYNKKIVKQ